MRCLCCGATYDRGHFVCCKAPNGMRSAAWLERHCKACAKCERHCGCERATVAPAHVEGWTHPVETERAARLVRLVEERGQPDGAGDGSVRFDGLDGPSSAQQKAHR